MVLLSHELNKLFVLITLLSGITFRLLTRCDLTVKVCIDRLFIGVGCPLTLMLKFVLERVCERKTELVEKEKTDQQHLYQFIINVRKKAKYSLVLV